MSKGLVTILGGSGFIGRYVTRILCQNGYRVRIAMRRPHLGGDLRLVGHVGQIQLVQANIRNRPSIERALDGASHVVNLVGILYEKGAQKFSGTHALGAANIAQLAAKAKCDSFIHISAIGADAHSNTQYQRSKGEGELAVKRAFPKSVILRPSIVFGPEDQFFNKFAEMSKFTPVLPSIGGGKTKFQPVYVGDVANAVMSAIENPNTRGKIFELGGPKEYTFNEILTYITKTIDRPRFLLPLSFPIAKSIGYICQATFKFWPFSGPPITGDQVEMLKSDNIVSKSRTVGRFSDLGIVKLEAVESIVPKYLWRFRPYGEFHKMSGHLLS